VLYIVLGTSEGGGGKRWGEGESEGGEKKMAVKGERI